MDGLKWENAAAALKKYGIGAAVLLLGLVLMAFPGEDSPPETAAASSTSATLEEKLAAILSHLEGAGKVKVLLTEATGAETIYQTELDASQKDASLDRREETVIVTGSDRNQSGLVRQTLPPRYQGAVVLCQGGENDRVRLQIVQAVMSVTGLRSDRITVLKMK